MNNPERKHKSADDHLFYGAPAQAQPDIRARFLRRVAAEEPKPKPQPEPEPDEEEQEAAKDAGGLICKGTITRLSAIADQGVEYDEEEEDDAAEPEQSGQLVAFEPQPEDETGPPPVYTPKEIIKLNRQHAVIANLGGKCVIMEFVPSNVTPETTEPAYQTFTSFRERYLNQYDQSRRRSSNALRFAEA